jgi:putative aldouronate transport system permease protein
MDKTATENSESFLDKIKIGRKNRNIRNRIEWLDLVLALILLFVIVITLYPFLNVLAVSFNDATDTARGGITIFPRSFTFQNYREIFSSNNHLLTAFRNSVLRTVIGTVLSTGVCALFAYILSRKKFVFNRLLTVMLVVTMYVSGGLIPSYLINRQLGLTNSFWVYIIPGLINAFNVIVIRSFIDGLPEALDESARIDGAGEFTIFWKIIMPLCKPVLATIALFVAVGQWNSWFDNYLYNSSNIDLTTLQFELTKIMDNAQSVSSTDVHMLNQQQMAGNTTTPESIKMAITVVATVPILVVYPFLQKYFVTGLTLGAVKE